MFRWFLSLFASRSCREIFWFYDGSKARGADPLAILRTLNANPSFGENLELLENAQGVDAFVEKASSEAMDAIREAFGLRRFDETGGLTELETMEVFKDFCAFIESLKKSSPRWSSLLATSPQPSTGEPSAKEATATTTPPLSGSGSTEIALATTSP